MTSLAAAAVGFYALAGVAVALTAAFPGTVLSEEGRPTRVSVLVWAIVAAAWPAFLLIWAYNTWGPRR